MVSTSAWFLQLNITMWRIMTGLLRNYFGRAAVVLKAVPAPSSAFRRLPQGLGLIDEGVGRRRIGKGGAGNDNGAVGPAP